MDADKKYEKYQWAVVTNIMDGCKLVTTNVENAKNMMELFKDWQTQFGLYPLLMVPTTGTGAIKSIPRTIYGEDCWYADITDFKSVIVNIHELSLDQVRAWYGWFMGREYQEPWISDNMAIKDI